MIKNNIYKLIKGIYRTKFIEKSIALIFNLLPLIPFTRTYCTEKTKRCSADVLNKNYLYYHRGRDSPVCCNTHLYETLRDIITCFNNNDIEYYIFYGTHLGAARHTGFIPWDTDIDLCVMDKNRGETLKILTQNLAKKYSIKEIDDTWMMVDYSTKNKVHADIYFMTRKNEYIYLKGYEQFQYLKSSIYPLKALPFYDLQLCSPNSLAPLYITYGNDCLTESVHQRSITNQKKINKFIPAVIDIRYMRK